PSVFGIDYLPKLVKARRDHSLDGLMNSQRAAAIWLSNPSSLEARNAPVVKRRGGMPWDLAGIGPRIARLILQPQLLLEGSRMTPTAVDRFSFMISPCLPRCAVGFPP